MIITRKIELYVQGSAEEKSAAWKFLRTLSKQVYKAYNMVVNHQYFNELLVERISKTDEELTDKATEIENSIAKLTEQLIAEKDADAKKKLKEKRNVFYKQQQALAKEARAKAVELYLTSEQNVTYQLLGKEFPDMPSSVRTVLNMDAVGQFKNAILDVKQGKQALPTFRDGIPIPIDKASIRFLKTETEKGVSEIGFNWVNHITFGINFGKDKSNNREIVERAIAGTYKYSNSKIQIDGKKIFLLFCFEQQTEQPKLDEKVLVGVNLGISVPAYCAVSNGLSRLAIGHYNDLFRVRRQFQQRRKRLQSNLTMVKGGKGRVDKLGALEALRSKERNYVKTYNHGISSKIVNFALKNNAATIVMELLEGYGEKVPDSIVLRNWSYFEVHQFVEYKAKKYGIKVVYSDPHRISQTCNVCGEYHENNLENRERFVCKNEKCSNFGVKVFSDYNAALNNATRPRFVERKEDCQHYKLYREVAA